VTRNDQILAMRAMGLSYRTIAKRLGCTHHVVAGVVYRAKTPAKPPPPLKEPYRPGVDPRPKWLNPPLAPAHRRSREQQSQSA